MYTKPVSLPLRPQEKKKHIFVIIRLQAVISYLQIYIINSLLALGALFILAACCICDCFWKHHFCSQTSMLLWSVCLLCPLGSRCVYSGYFGVLNRLDRESSPKFMHVASSLHLDCYVNRAQSSSCCCHWRSSRCRYLDLVGGSQEIYCGN